MHFDFKRLSSADLEDLTRDIFQKSLNKRLESFSSGRDNGIDVRYSSPAKENEIVIQCKHYSNWGDLMASLKKEVNNVKALKPKRYIVVTILPLNPERKSKILTLFSPFILNTSDIWGEKDLEMALGDEEFADVLKKHIKLWLDSSVILEHILESSISKLLLRLPKKIAQIVHAPEYNRAITQKEKIENSLKVFVSNKSFNDSLELLIENHYCIISGAPGIGKTTLANMLSYYFMQHGYELICVSGDIDEAYKLFKAERKQIFYYDDFLGSNFSEEGLAKNEDQRIIDFIAKVSRSENKKLVFTTREYILQQAIDKYPKFDKDCGTNMEKICFSKCIVELKDYTKLNRARIIYNHWYYAKLPQKIKNDILGKNLYHKLIDHKNFNPRVIQWISKIDNITEFNNGNEYIEHASKILDDPSALWECAFSNHISRASRDLLFCMVSLSTGTDIKLLKRTWVKLQEQNKDKYGITWENNDFERSLKELEGSFVKISKTAYITVDFFDPSVKDFLIKKIKNNLPAIKDLLKASIFWGQTKNIFYATINSDGWDIEKRRMIKKSVWDDSEVLELIKVNFDKSTEESLEEKLFWIADRELKVEEFIKAKIHEIKRNPNNNEYFFALLTKFPDLEDFQHAEFVEGYLKQVMSDDLKNLTVIISVNELKDYLDIIGFSFAVLREKADEALDELIDFADYNSDGYEVEHAFETAEALEYYFGLPNTASEHIGEIINRIEEYGEKESELKAEKDEYMEDIYREAYADTMSDEITLQNIENLFNAGL